MFMMVGCQPSEIEIYSNPEVLNDLADYPILKDEYLGNITLKLMGANNSAINPDWASNKFFIRMENLTGVKFKFEVYGDDMYDEKKALTLSTNTNLPDIFFKANFQNYDDVAYGGKSLRALNDLIEDYAPNIKRILDENPIIKQSITTRDGNIYSLPTMYLNLPNDNKTIMRDFFWINKKWMNEIPLEIFNKEMPTTTDELLTVLRWFKENKTKGNNQYPLVLSGKSDILRIFNFFGLDMRNYWVQSFDNDELVFGPTTDNFKEALEFLNICYKEGLINKNWSSFSKTEMSAIGSSGDVYGAYITAAPQYVSGYARMKDFIAMNPLISSTNNTPMWGATNPLENGTFAITTASKYPELAIRWIDTLYDLSKDYGLWAIIGQEGEEWQWKNSEKESWESIVPESSYSQIMAKTIIQAGDGMPYAVDESFWEKQQTPNDTYTRPQRNEQMSYGKVGFPNVYFDNKEFKLMGDIASDIESYIMRFISNAISRDNYLNSEWNQFIQFKNLRLDEYLRILQEALDDFNEGVSLNK